MKTEKEIKPSKCPESKCVWWSLCNKVCIWTSLSPTGDPCSLETFGRINLFKPTENFLLGGKPKETP